MKVFCLKLSYEKYKNSSIFKNIRIPKIPRTSKTSCCILNNHFKFELPISVSDINASVKKEFLLENH